MDIKTDHFFLYEVQGDRQASFRPFTICSTCSRCSTGAPERAVRVKAETTDPDWFNLVIQCRDPLASSTAVQLQDWRNESLLNGTDQDTPEQEHLARINLYTLDKMIRSMSGTLQMPDGQHLALKMVISLPMKLAVVTDVPAPIQDWIEPLRILLVEDHFLNQIATKNVLQTWSPDLTVDIAENGLVAVEKFQAHEYDLVLMDIQMPVMNGLIAGKKIRELSNVPIIALSAYASEQEAEKCLRAGFSDYLAKPFKPEELKHKVFRLASLVR
ncbi:MAG: response regulator [Saprospiraceae bacterium]